MTPQEKLKQVESYFNPINAPADVLWLIARVKQLEAELEVLREQNRLLAREVLETMP